MFLLPRQPIKWYLTIFTLFNLTASTIENSSSTFFTSPPKNTTPQHVTKNNNTSKPPLNSREITRAPRRRLTRRDFQTNFPLELITPNESFEMYRQNRSCLRNAWIILQIPEDSVAMQFRGPKPKIDFIWYRKSQPDRPAILVSAMNEFGGSLSSVIRASIDRTRFKQNSKFSLEVKCIPEITGSSISLFAKHKLFFRNDEIARFKITVKQPPEDVVMWVNPSVGEEPLAMQQALMPFATCSTVSRPKTKFNWRLTMVGRDGSLVSREIRLDAQSTNFFDEGVALYNTSSTALVPLYNYQYHEAKITCIPVFADEKLEMLNRTAQIALAFPPQELHIERVSTGPNGLDEFRCIGYANPPKIRYQWQSSEENITVFGQVVKLGCSRTNDAKRSGSCEVTCIASNDFGQGMTSLTIQPATRISSDRPRITMIPKNPRLYEAESLNFADFQRWFLDQATSVKIFSVALATLMVLCLIVMALYFCYVGSRKILRKLRFHNCESVQISGAHCSTVPTEVPQSAYIASYMYAKQYSSGSVSSSMPLVLNQNGQIIKSRTLNEYPEQSTAPYGTTQRSTVNGLEGELSPKTKEEWEQIRRIFGHGTVPRQMAISEETQIKRSTTLTMY